MYNWTPGYGWPPQFMVMQPSSNEKDSKPDLPPKPDKKEKSLADILRQAEDDAREVERYIEGRKQKKATEKKEERKKKWWKLSEVWIAFSFASLLQAPIWLMVFLFLIKDHVR